MNEAELLHAIEGIVSPGRFRRYQAGAGTDLDAVTRYLWNVRLAEALFPSIAVFEVTLRNAVHQVLTRHAGTEFWFKSVLQQQTYDNIVQLIGTLTRRIGHLPSADKVVSEITFGFWAKLFAKRYNSLWWDRPRPLLAEVIRHHPGVARDTRSQFETRLEYFVALRNRTMHHEAVFQGIAALNRPVLQLRELHGQLIETIGWIDPDAIGIVTCVDRFAYIQSDQGYQTTMSSLRDVFSIR